MTQSTFFAGNRKQRRAAAAMAGRRTKPLPMKKWRASCKASQRNGIQGLYKIEAFLQRGMTRCANLPFPAGND